MAAKNTIRRLVDFFIAMAPEYTGTNTLKNGVQTKTFYADNAHDEVNVDHGGAKDDDIFKNTHCQLDPPNTVCQYMADDHAIPNVPDRKFVQQQSASFKNTKHYTSHTLFVLDAFKHNWLVGPNNYIDSAPTPSLHEFYLLYGMTYNNATPLFSSDQSELFKLSGFSNFDVLNYMYIEFLCRNSVVLTEGINFAEIVIPVAAAAVPGLSGAAAATAAGVVVGGAVSPAEAAAAGAAAVTAGGAAGVLVAGAGARAVAAAASAAALVMAIREMYALRVDPATAATTRTAAPGEAARAGAEAATAVPAGPDDVIIREEAVLAAGVQVENVIISPNDIFTPGEVMRTTLPANPPFNKAAYIAHKDRIILDNVNFLWQFVLIYCYQAIEELDATDANKHYYQMGLFYMRYIHFVELQNNVLSFGIWDPTPANVANHPRFNIIFDQLHRVFWKSKIREVYAPFVPFTPFPVPTPDPGVAMYEFSGKQPAVAQAIKKITNYVGCHTVVERDGNENLSLEDGINQLSQPIAAPIRDHVKARIYCLLKFTGDTSHIVFAKLMICAYEMIPAANFVIPGKNNDPLGIEITPPTRL